MELFVDFVGVEDCAYLLNYLILTFYIYVHFIYDLSLTQTKTTIYLINNLFFVFLNKFALQGYDKLK